MPRVRVLAVVLMTLGFFASGCKRGRGRVPGDPPRSTPPLAASEPIGSLDGSFAVSGEGTATYTVPIEVPAGRGELEPKLSLNYAGGGGDGSLGTGWSLGGLSRISRCGSSLAHDGIVRPVKYDAGDHLCLDDQRLVDLGGGEYRTRPDSFSRIVADGDGWVVQTKDGRVLRYGTTAASRLDGEEEVAAGDTGIQLEVRRHAWLLDRVEDRVGNYMLYRYERTPGIGSDIEVRLVEIAYTGFRGNGAAAASEPRRKVAFEWEDRPDPGVTHVHGVTFRTTRRLRRIVTSAPALGGGAPAVHREYRLTYDVGPLSRRSRLIAVTGCDAAGVCVPPTRFTYSDAAPRFSSNTYPVATVRAGRYAFAFTADVDGDGRDDLVYQDTRGNVHSAADGLAVMRSTGAGLLAPAQSAGPPWGDSGWGLDDVFAFDHDQDGRADVIATYTRERCVAPRCDVPEPATVQETRWRAFPSTGSGFDATGRKLGIGAVGDAGRGVSLRMADADANVNADLVYQVPRCPARMACFDDPPGAGTPLGYEWVIDRDRVQRDPAYVALGRCPPGTAGEPNCEDVHPEAARLLDLDGDGASELLLPYVKTKQPNNTGVLGYDVIRKRHSTVEVERSNFESAWEFYDGAFTPGATNCTVFADVNGDGLVDAVDLRDGVTVRRSLGNGRFTEPARLAVDPGVVTVPECIHNEKDGGVRVVDYNQDGRQDLLLLGRTSALDTHARILDLAGDRVRAIRVDIPLTTSLGDAWGALTGDFDGDGLFDVVQHDAGRGWQLTMQTGGRADLLVRIENGLGGVVRELEYATLTGGPYRRTAPCSRAAPCSGGGVVVVAAESVGSIASSGAEPTAGLPTPAFRHAYADAVFARDGEGWLGFRTHTVTDVRSGVIKRTTYALDERTIGGRRLHPFRGLPREELTWAQVGDTRRVSRTTTVHAVLPTSGGHSYTSFEAEVTQQEYEGEHLELDGLDAATPMRTVITTSQIDELGNITRVGVQRGAGVASETERTYENDTSARWSIGRLVRERIASKNGQIHVRETAYVHEPDGSGRIRDVERAPRGPAALRRCTRVVGRDPYGTAIRWSTTPGGCEPTALSRTEEVTLDEEGIHVIADANALGHRTSRRVFPASGLAYAETDANGLTTFHQFDGFGRKRRTQRPDGGWTELRLSQEPGYPLVTTVTSSDGSATATRLDKLGREVRRSTRTFAGAWADVDITYDHLGQVRRVTRPRVGAGPDVAAIRYTYDELGRVTAICRKRCARRVYRGLTTEDFDEDGRRQVTVEDAAGLTRSSSIHPAGPDAAAVTTTFAHGPFDTLVQVRDAAGNVVRQDFDAWGRRTLVDDPDAGPTTFAYDAFDQLERTTDAAGITVTYTHDALGRVLTRTAPDGVDAFVYDRAPGKGIGEVASQTRSPAGAPALAGDVVERFTYDPFGRVATTTWEIDGARHEAAQAYDEHGRLREVAYPEVPGLPRVAVRYAYNAAGFLSQVTAGGATVWRAADVDAEGRLLEQVLGNGLTERRTHEPDTGRLSSLRIARAAAPPLVAEDYRHASNGDLRSRTDVVAGLTERFTYDGADRLISASIDGRAPVTYAYDDLGNLLTAGDLGDCRLAYGEPAAAAARRPGPHALTSITCAGRTHAVRHDLGGNVIADELRGLTLAYTSFGKAHTATRGAVQVDLAYDATHNRVRKRTRGGDTAGDVVYVGDLLEIRRTAGQAAVDHVFHVAAADGTVAQLHWRWDPGAAAGRRAWRYLHRDRMGSVVAVSDEDGAAVARMSYDAFGRPRNADGTYPADALPAGSRGDVRFGFTGHTSDDELGLVDMGARLYDPMTKRFLQPDPLVQDPLYGPAWNRYSYVYNNPLRFDDPSGHLAQGIDEIMIIVEAFGAFIVDGITPEVDVEIKLSDDGQLVPTFRTGEFSEGAGIIRMVVGGINDRLAAPPDGETQSTYARQILGESMSIRIVNGNMYVRSGEARGILYGPGVGPELHLGVAAQAWNRSQQVSAYMSAMPPEGRRNLYAGIAASAVAAHAAYIALELSMTFAFPMIPGKAPPEMPPGVVAMYSNGGQQVGKAMPAAVARRLGPKDPPQRYEGPLTLRDVQRMKEGKGPLDLVPLKDKKGRDVPIALHHGGQQPKGTLHEVVQNKTDHYAPGTHGQPNQGVTDRMRASDRRAYWRDRVRQMGY